MAHKKIKVLNSQRKAMSVHLLTATGAIFAMLALLSAAQEKWDIMFIWLVIAFAIDGIDGPLARKFNVIVYAPRYDGSLLDLIIDYMTYAFIPAFALYWSDVLPGWMGLSAIAIITFATAIYFADRNMKTKDCYFVGFPGCWNMFILVVFQIGPDIWLIFIGVIVLGIAMFLPLNFIHPIRTVRWRSLSLPIALLWVVMAAWSAWGGRHADNPWVNAILLSASLYLLCVGIIQQIFPSKTRFPS